MDRFMVFLNSEKNHSIPTAKKSITYYFDLMAKVCLDAFGRVDGGGRLCEQIVGGTQMVDALAEFLALYRGRDVDVRQGREEKAFGVHVFDPRLGKAWMVHEPDLFVGVALCHVVILGCLHRHLRGDEAVWALFFVVVLSLAMK